jgi:hypothetical protein
VTLILYFFTEAHLDNSISDADISLAGFEVPIRRDRNCSGGGIIFYYKSFVNVIHRQDLEHGDLLECTNPAKLMSASLMLLSKCASVKKYNIKVFNYIYNIT